MKGTVAMYNVPANIGFIAGGDGVEYFVHASNITPPVDGFAVLLPGWQVEFTPGNGKEGPEAFSVTPPVEMGGLHVVRGPKAVQLPKGGVARLRWRDNKKRLGSGGDAEVVAGVDFIHPVRNDAVEPSLQASTFSFSAYYVGPQKVGGFLVETPSSDASRIFLVLDKDKEVKKVLEGESVEVRPRSYVIMVAASGFVIIWTLCSVHRRFDGRNHNWVVVQVRFEHQYDLSGAPLSTLSIEERTPESGAGGPNRKRNNRQFAPVIASCLKALLAQQTESEQ